MQNPTTDFYSAAFADATVGLALVGIQGRCLEVNPALCQILGYRRDELLARTFHEITHPDDLLPDQRQFERVLAGEIDSYTLDKRYRHADGRVVWGRLTVSVRRDASGAPDCILGQLLDISAQKDRDALFALAADLLAIAGTDGYLRQVNPAWTETLGWSASELTSRPFIDFVHPDERAATLAAAERIYRGGVARGFRNRYLHADGSYRWLDWSTHAAANGMLYCAVRDVSEQVRNEERLRSQERKIRLLIDDANDAFLGMDQEGIITEWNKQAEAIFGWSAQEAIGQPMADLMVPARLRQRHNEGLRHFLRTNSAGAPSRKRVEVPALRKDGSEILVEMTVGAMGFGDEQYFHAFMRDVSEQRRLSEQLHYRATHDFLTGLTNRYAFMCYLQDAIDEADADPRSLALLFIDLDGFKAINDLCGHEVGDKVLIAFAKRLRNAVRHTDRVARLAGDEFVVLLDRLDDPWREALPVIATILRAAAQPYPEIGGRGETRASIGMALHRQGGNAETLLSQADAAMYVAKNAGKNCAAFERDGQWVVHRV